MHRIAVTELLHHITDVSWTEGDLIYHVQVRAPHDLTYLPDAGIHVEVASDT
jgi:hypothetical protein